MDRPGLHPEVPTQRMKARTPYKRVLERGPRLYWLPRAGLQQGYKKSYRGIRELKLMRLEAKGIGGADIIF
jgi:hypothetical protein